MTTLDAIARSSANAVHVSVSNVRAPVGGVAAAAQALAAWRIAGYALAGATVGAAMVFVLLLAQPTLDDPAQNVVPTTDAVVPTTLPATPVPPTTVPQTQSEEQPPVAAVPGESGTTSTTEPADAEPPLLEVISPKDGERFESNVVTFSGRTEPGAVVIASGKFPASVNEDGLWAVDLVLATGANGVVFRALDAAGNESDEDGADRENEPQVEAHHVDVFPRRVDRINERQRDRRGEDAGADDDLITEALDERLRPLRSRGWLWSV